MGKKLLLRIRGDIDYNFKTKLICLLLSKPPLVSSSLLSGTWSSICSQWASIWAAPQLPTGDFSGKRRRWDGRGLPQHRIRWRHRWVRVLSMKSVSSAHPWVDFVMLWPSDGSSMIIDYERDITSRKQCSHELSCQDSYDLPSSQDILKLPYT